VVTFSTRVVGALGISPRTILATADSVSPSALKLTILTLNVLPMLANVNGEVIVSLCRPGFPLTFGSSRLLTSVN